RIASASSRRSIVLMKSQPASSPSPRRSSRSRNASSAPLAPAGGAAFLGAHQVNNILADRIRLDLLAELTEALAVMEQNPDDVSRDDMVEIADTALAKAIAFIWLWREEELLAGK